MTTNSMIRPLFVIAALYDAILGAAFLFAPSQVFAWIDLQPPNHLGYVQFPAALLIVFGIMFAAIAKDPHRNRNLITYGILLKVCYCGVVLFHWIGTGVPYVWKPFFFADIVFVAAFVWAWNVLSTKDA